MGIETEFGISVTGDPGANPMVASSQVIGAYGSLTGMGSRSRWDYEREFPLRDARGYDMSRADADPSMITNEDLGLANFILTNGARLYVDHAHPEYSTPEVTNPLDAALWDRAGVVVMAAAADRAAHLNPGQAFQLYKNNTDNKGASYGCHENYLMRRSTPFAEVVRSLTPFFVSRQVFTGTGRVGVGQDGSVSRFQLTQRADFFEVEVGLETTLKRPIINTRDEPHADPERYRRLHVIVGDANLCDVATYLKMGTTSLVLAMIEDGWLAGVDLRPVKPVRALHQVSHDVTLSELIELADGRQVTALDLQDIYWVEARGYVDQRFEGPADAQTEDVLNRWRAVLDALRTDPSTCAREVDWVAKLALLDAYRERDGLDWASPRLQAVDLQFSDVRADKGLAFRLEARGRLQRLFSDGAVAHAVDHPPSDTRAWFRGECMRRYAPDIAAASWDGVVFDLADDASARGEPPPPLTRVQTLDPLKGSAELVAGLLDASPTAADLVRALQSDGRVLVERIT